MNSHEGAVETTIDNEPEKVISIGAFLAPQVNGHHAIPAINPTEAEPPIRIDAGLEHLPTLNKLCWEAIARGNEPPVLFQHGSSIVRATASEETGVALQAVTISIMRHHLSQWAVWHRDNKRFAKPPEDVVKDVMASHHIQLPRLRRIVRVPVFCRQGKLVITPGFHDESGILYLPAEGFQALPLPEVITEEDVNAANKLICEEVLIDFPFAETADRDNAVALFLLPFVRDMIAGPTPNHLIEASMPGSGKGKLASAVLYASVGSDLGLITAPRDDDEWRKQITSSLLAAKPVVLIDNVGRMVDSPALAAAWTAEIWDDRILGTKEKANVPIRCCWVMTANNPVMSSELIRRSVRIRLTPKTDHPEARTDFRHADLTAWLGDHRPELVRAAHILIQWWIQNAQPKPASCPQMGSFEDWMRVIGGILESVGYGQFLANKQAFVENADPQRAARGVLCATWFDWLSREENRLRQMSGVTATELLPVVDGIEGLNFEGATDRARATKLGKWLQANLEMYVSHSEQQDNGGIITRRFTIVKGIFKKGSQYWVVQCLD